MVPSMTGCTCNSFPTLSNRRNSTATPLRARPAHKTCLDLLNGRAVDPNALSSAMLCIYASLFRKPCARLSRAVSGLQPHDEPGPRGSTNSSEGAESLPLREFPADVQADL